MILGMIVEGEVDKALIAQVPNPNTTGRRAYHDFYVLVIMLIQARIGFMEGEPGGIMSTISQILENPELISDAYWNFRCAIWAYIYSHSRWTICYC